MRSTPLGQTTSTAQVTQTYGLTDTLTATQPLEAQQDAALLEEALSVGSLAMARQALLRMGAFSINQSCDSYNRTPLLVVLCFARHDDLLELVDVALRRGARTDCADVRGRGPIELALRRRASTDCLIAVIGKLLAHGCRMDVSLSTGDTLLGHLLLRHQLKPHHIERMAPWGVDFNALDRHGLPPLAHALLAPHGETPDLLNALMDAQSTTPTTPHADVMAQRHLAMWMVLRFFPRDEHQALLLPLVARGAAPDQALGMVHSTQARRIEAHGLACFPLPSLDELQAAISRWQGVVRYPSPVAEAAPAANTQTSLQRPLHPGMAPGSPQKKSERTLPPPPFEALKTTQAPLPKRPLSAALTDGQWRRGLRTISFWRAIRDDKADAVTHLLKSDPNLIAQPDPKTGELPIGLAAKLDRRELLDMLVKALQDSAAKQGADWRYHLEQRDTEGMSALMWAVQKGHVHVVRQILMLGASLSATAPLRALPENHRWMNQQPSLLLVALLNHHAFICRQLLEAESAQGHLSFDHFEAGLVAQNAFGPNDAVSQTLRAFRLSH